MKFSVKPLDLEAGGKAIVVLSGEDAKALGAISSDRVELRKGELKAVAILNTSSEFPAGSIGVFKEVKSRLHLDEGDSIDTSLAGRPPSLGFIREKIMGERLTSSKLGSIVEDVVERRLSDIELASFVTSLQIHGTSLEEVEGLSRAMIGTGKTIDFKRDLILDKHSIGGVPGDKTTLLVVPIVAAAGYTIPKSSSRAITTPAGTADRMEVLAPVELGTDEIRDVVDRAGGCIVWGGALDLAPADDLFIQVEYPLSIDPLLLPSIMSKKRAMGSTHVVVDIPTGRGAKIKTIGQAQRLAYEFIEIGRRLGMKIQCAVTEGEQPVGKAVGPALEAREALETLGGAGPETLIDKATSLAGLLFEMVGENNGRQKALDILSSGKALEKMHQIIEAQGGDPDVRPGDLPVGDKWMDIKAERKGRVLWINNQKIAMIARTAGAPNDKGAGLLLNVMLGDEVKKGDTLLRIYAENKQKLSQAVEQADEIEPLGVGRKIGEPMLIAKITGETKSEEYFILER